MKEWKKPFCKVVVLEEVEIITDSGISSDDLRSGGDWGLSPSGSSQGKERNGGIWDE